MIKKIGLLLVASSILGIAYLGVKGSEMQEIRTEIIINAPVAKVWGALIDIDRWHEWSPTIRASEGRVALGNKLNITMACEEPDKDGPKYSPKITELTEKKVLRWRAHMLAGFIFTNDKVLKLEEVAGGTKLVHKELFSGLLAPIMCGHMEEGVPPMLNSMNEALKKMLEAS